MLRELSGISAMLLLAVGMSAETVCIAFAFFFFVSFCAAVFLVNVDIRRLALRAAPSSVQARRRQFRFARR